jgi:hypothetical protein
MKWPRLEPHVRVGHITIETDYRVKFRTQKERLRENLALCLSVHLLIRFSENVCAKPRQQFQTSLDLSDAGKQTEKWT